LNSKRNEETVSLDEGDVLNSSTETGKNLPEGWEIKKLKEVCQIKPPKKESKELLTENENVSFVPMDLLGIDRKYISLNKDKQLSDVSSSYTYFRDGDVLLAKITPCFENGKLGIAKGLTNTIGFGSSEFIVYRPDDNLNAEFLYYFLNQEIFREKGKSLMTGAVGHKRIPKDFYEEYNIPIPPLSEQKRIVAILDKAFAAIDQARANIEKNIENARELFQSKLNEIFSQKGEGWEEKKLGEVCEFVRGPFGGSLKKNCFVEEGFAVYEQQHAINNQFESIRYYIDKTKFGEMQRFELKYGDLIMSCSGTMGKVAIVPEGIQSGIINQALLKLTPNKIINKEYLKRWMESTHFFYEIAKNSKGAAIKNVASVKILKEIKVPLPSNEIQKGIIDTIDSLESRINGLVEIYNIKRIAVEELKKSILQKAFRGEL